ncbi:MAG: hypothetical protein HQL91_09180 [Magnetococcales bacterium]|nr:hypothetical protein [Magnetococcales bacterium]
MGYRSGMVWLAAAVLWGTGLDGVRADDPSPTETQPAAQTPAAPAAPAAKSGAGRGREMIGRTRDDLVKAFGQPVQMMDVTIMGRPPSEAWIYPVGNCLDTYVLLEKTGEVVDYFCR